MENAGTKSIQFTLIGLVATLTTFYLYKTILKANKRQNLPVELKHTKYTAELVAATEVALEAGENMICSRTVDSDVTVKGDNDFVTKTDVQNETLIHKILHLLVTTSVHQESVSDSNSTTLTATPTWIVDPIDGTTNFLHSFPFSCVSIGLVVDHIPTVGVVYNPSTKELFQSIRGHGAYLNGKRIRVSNATSLKQALVLTELGYDRAPHKLRVMFACLDELISKRGVHSVRMLGSACMALCYLATGRLDALYTGANGDGWKPWDYAAGACIVSEAGGALVTATGGPFDVFSGSLVATSSESLGSELVEALSGHVDMS